jgi:hypothetical protein
VAATAACAHLMGDVRPRLTDVAAHLPHDTNVVVAVEEVVFVLSRPRTPTGAVRGLVRLEGGIAQHDNQALCVFVVGGNGCMLFSDQFGELWWRHGLGSYRLQSYVSAIEEEEEDDDA